MQGRFHGADVGEAAGDVVVHRRHGVLHGRDPVGRHEPAGRLAGGHPGTGWGLHGAGGVLVARGLRGVAGIQVGPVVVGGGDAALLGQLRVVRPPVAR